MAPSDGGFWIIATQYGGSGTGDLWFEPWSAATGIHVKVWYADSTTDEADAVNSPQPPPPSLSASFLGSTGQDHVNGPALQPNGTADWHVQLTGLRSTPVKVQIGTSAGGVWMAPSDEGYWIIATQYGGSGAGDLWFEPWNAPSGIHVKVWYADGTADEADAP